MQPWRREVSRRAAPAPACAGWRDGFGGGAGGAQHGRLSELRAIVAGRNQVTIPGRKLLATRAVMAVLVRAGLTEDEADSLIDPVKNKTTMGASLPSSSGSALPRPGNRLIRPAKAG